MKETIPSKKELNTYQLIAVICFIGMMVFGWKYTKLKDAYKVSESQKSEYCTQYYSLLCNVEKKQ